MMLASGASTRVDDLIRAGILEIGDGYRAKNSELGSEGIPFARAANVKDGFHFGGADLVPKGTLAKVGAKRSRAGDVVFTSKGTVGRFARVAVDTPDFVYSPQLCFWRSLNNDIIDPRYLFYWMQGPESLNQIQVLKGQTDMADYVSLRDQKGMQITLPAIEAQRRKASILGALDDKIDSNRRLALLLEETSATLFRGLKAKLISDAESEERSRGRTSMGSRSGSLYEVAAVTYGRPFKAALFSASEGVPLIRIRDLGRDMTGLRTPEERPDARLILPGDIVVGMDGEFRAHLWHGPESFLNQRVCALDPLPGVSRAYLFEAIKEPLAHFEATKVGSTVIHLGKHDFDTVKLLIPSETAMTSFATVADPLLEKCVALRAECRTLSEIRDALLPKLVSGGISVQNADEAAEVA